MKEIVCINLENEMDLILAHKRSMKIAELCGQSHIIQTTFATAVSEVARFVIGKNHKSDLLLCLVPTKGNRKDLVAVIRYDGQPAGDQQSAINYARKLVNDVSVVKQKKGAEVVLTQGINFSGLITDARIESFITYFKNELPLSPYDELRKKNIQLIELSERLRESDTQYQSLTGTLPLIMFVTNAGGFITFANKGLKDFFDMQEVELGKLSWMSLVSIEDNKDVRNAWEKSLENKTTCKLEVRLKNKKTNTLAWHLVTVVPVKDDQNQLAGWTGFFVDIDSQKFAEKTMRNNTELKAIQKQLLNSQSKLEDKVSELNKSNHDLEQFAYIASHDLQEPLRKIRSFTELLAKNITNENKRESYLDKIDKSCERMILLVKNVLDYSRLRKSQAVFEQVSLQEIINSVKIDMELAIEDKNAVINSPALPTITGVKPQLYQLFYNLIGNALKFSTTTPEINISMHYPSSEEIQKNKELLSGAKYIEITVKDNGIGFDQKYANQIFTIFKRLNTREEYSGTGIGLALCKKIVDNHHGSISAESKPGEGAEFKIILPVD